MNESDFGGLRAASLELDGKRVCDVTNVKIAAADAALWGAQGTFARDYAFATEPKSVGTRFFPVTVRRVNSAGSPCGRFEAELQIQGQASHYVGCGETPDKAIEELRAVIYGYEELTAGEVELPADFEGLLPTDETLHDQVADAEDLSATLRSELASARTRVRDLEARNFGLRADLEAAASAQRTHESQADDELASARTYWIGEWSDASNLAVKHYDIAQEALELIHKLILERDDLKKRLKAAYTYFPYGGSFIA